MATEQRSVEAARLLSRRGLLGAGLGRALQAQLAAVEAAASGSRTTVDGDQRPPRVTAPLSWGEGDSRRLGALLGPVREHLLEVCRVRAGMELLDATAGDGALASAAVRRGARVTAAEREGELIERGRAHSETAGTPVQWHRAAVSAPPARDGGFDAVLSCFSASHLPDPRAAARGLTVAAAPGAPIAFTAWTGLLAQVMAAALPNRRARPERWARYETVRLFFADFPDCDVTEHCVMLEFRSPGHAAEILCAPVAGRAAEQRLRAALPRLLEAHRVPGPAGLTLRADYALVHARRP